MKAFEADLRFCRSFGTSVFALYRFLPSYSPNLNLIERLWKFVKKKSLYNEYYETFAEFVAGIMGCLDRVETDYKDEIDTLMQPNFQDLKNVKLMAA